MFKKKRSSEDKVQLFEHAKQNLIVKEINKYKASFQASNLSVDDLKDTESAMIYYCHGQDFADELSSETSGQLRNSEMPVESKNPAVIPKNI